MEKTTNKKTPSLPSLNLNNIWQIDMAVRSSRPVYSVQNLSQSNSNAPPPAKCPEQIRTVNHLHSLRMACLHLSHTNPCIICISNVRVPFVWTLPLILNKPHTQYSNIELDVERFISNNKKQHWVTLLWYYLLCTKFPQLTRKDNIPSS